MSPVPNPDEAHTAINIPAGATYDWLTWITRGLLAFAAGLAAKLWKDVSGLKHWRTEQTALYSQRDEERREILSTVKRIEEKLSPMGERVAFLEGRNEGETRHE